MLQGAASTDVRRTSVWRRAATGLLAVGVCVATGLGAASVDTASGPVTQAALDSSPSSLVGLTAGPLPSSAAARDLPGPAAVVDTTGAGRLARPALAAGDIPPAAWEAYLRAAAVLAKAAPRCGLDWTVLAAIGLVESDHGRSSTGTGVDGRRRTAPDTDGGRLDGDPARDITVGPMRLLPSTWQVIGVDGDGDGIRSPADPDDAALAVGVALCAGDAHLGTRAGLRRALLRYAPSPAYVDLVIRIARSYAQAASPAPTATVATIAHPVVDGARTTLARRSLARRVEAAGSATVKSVGVGSSPSAQLLSTALASHSPPSATAAGPTAASPTAAGPTAASPATEASSASPSTAAPSTPLHRRRPPPRQLHRRRPPPRQLLGGGPLHAGSIGGGSLHAGSIGHWSHRCGADPDAGDGGRDDADFPDLVGWSCRAHRVRAEHHEAGRGRCGSVRRSGGYPFERPDTDLPDPRSRGAGRRTQRRTFSGSRPDGRPGSTHRPLRRGAQPAPARRVAGSYPLIRRLRAKVAHSTDRRCALDGPKVRTRPGSGQPAEPVEPGSEMIAEAGGALTVTGSPQ